MFAQGLKPLYKSFNCKVTKKNKTTNKLIKPTPARLDWVNSRGLLQFRNRDHWTLDTPGATTALPHTRRHLMEPQTLGKP